MSTINVTKNGNTITILGDLTNDYNKMRNECEGRMHSLFGDIKNMKGKLGDPLTEEEILELYNNGTNKSFYENIWGYICIKPDDYSNYLFAIIDSENRYNQYNRLRAGVYQFYSKAKFDVYVIPSA